MTVVTFVRRHPLLVSLGALALLLVALGLLALPLRSVPATAADAQRELTTTVDALKAGDTDVAWRHLAAARGHVDEVTGVTDGPSGQVWSRVPVVGRGVGDARDLATAMDELTSALEVAEELHPRVSGAGSTLVTDGDVDLDTMGDVVAAVGRVEGHLVQAREHLEAVGDEAPLLGTAAAEKRDVALEQVAPVTASLERLRPLVDVLPQVMGAEGERKYLLAMMNPSEVKYSGGSMLTFATVVIDDGTMRTGKVRDMETNPKLFRRGFWENVEGNVFASPYSERITHASIAPSWPISGEETLRSWEWLRRLDPDEGMDGLVAVDVVALSHLLRVTGPFEVRGLGEVNADNLVELTAGDYERFTSAQQSQRKSLNRRLIPAFTERFFGDVDFVGTMRAIGRAAEERHLAVYFRDEAVQSAVAEFGLDGDLSPTDHDYLGVFTQNIVGSKADYYQRKDVTSRVVVREDGSARVTLTAAVDNTHDGVVTGELSAYTEPTITMFLATFLPRGAEVRRVAVSDSDGQRPGGDPDPTISDAGEYFGRPWVRERVVARAGDRAQLELVYDVPSVAEVSGDRMTYRLDVDPHPTVLPARTQVTVVWPQGWRTDALPAGWRATQQGHAVWRDRAMAARQSWAVTATRE